MKSSPTSVEGHHYIIVVIDYFTKWAKEIPTFIYDSKNASLFMFNHIIAWFGIHEAIVTNHGSHFSNKIMIELSSMLGFHQE